MENLTLRKAIEMAVATEELGAKYYQEIAEKFSDERDVARVFKQLAEDEVAHETQFKNLLDEVPPEKDAVGQEDAGLLLRAAATSQFFDRKAIANTAEISTPADALAKALAFERSTLFYYQSIQEVLGESPQLQKMIDAEKSHVTTLMKVIISDAKFRGLADPW
jgi:rubrerythrin